MRPRARFIWIPTALTLVAGAVVLSMRLWNRRFVSVDIENIPIDVDGEIKSARRITIQSLLKFTPQETWQMVQTPALFSQVTKPVILFSNENGQPLPLTFHEQDTLQLKMRGFGFIPLGRHAITIERIDPELREIHTNEQGQIAQIWRHRISVRPYGKDQTLYTDQIDLYAGRQTKAVAAFARFFYMYRHTRWQKLSS